MSRLSMHARSTRRLLTTLGVLALFLASVTPTYAEARDQSSFSVDKLGRPTINTHRMWLHDYDGIFGFGAGVQTTGQVITIPKRATDLMGFRYYLCHYDGPDQITLRGEVFQWDAGTAMATGTALWESAAKTITGGNCDVSIVNFHVPAVQLTAGGQYILFITVSKDDGQSLGDWVWDVLRDDGAYPKGTNYYLDDGGDESQWTTRSWGTIHYDMAMKVWLRPHVASRH